MRRPWVALGAGILGTLFLLPFSTPEELRQRAILWTGGLSVLGPQGADGWLPAMERAWAQLSPGFWFPYHAHDTQIQLQAVLGWAGVGAWFLLVWPLMGSPAASGIAGVLIGSLTQEVGGDLEVARGLYLWGALLLLSPTTKGWGHVAWSLDARTGR